jgi:hypothetical protein
MSAAHPGRFILVLLLLASACRSQGFAPAEDAMPDATPAEKVIQGGLKRHGYSEWRSEETLVFKLRTREIGPEGQRTTESVYSCDIQGHRIHAQGSKGGADLHRRFQAGQYYETLNGQEERSPKALLKGRQRIIDDYFFTVLPFFVAAQPPREMEALSREKIAGVNYDVIEVQWEEQGPFPPKGTYRLYYTHSTQRLEKVFFQTHAVEREGEYIWFECDNFALMDGVLLPLHRTFTQAAGDQGMRSGRPFLEQWIYDVRIGATVDEALFSR